MPQTKIHLRVGSRGVAGVAEAAQGIPGGQRHQVRRPGRTPGRAPPRRAGGPAQPFTGQGANPDAQRCRSAGFTEGKIPVGSSGVIVVMYDAMISPLHHCASGPSFACISQVCSIILMLRNLCPIFTSRASVLGMVSSLPALVSPPLVRLCFFVP